MTGVLAAGKSPKVLRAWRALIATSAPWRDALIAASLQEESMTTTDLPASPADRDARCPV
ncbi:hypothetical protein [Actinoplanes sp. ATCC 53533]|uniref:hypothetical protein n=1 Tax=Actinoplanes sp. ATCC 53533 TaxID=1288362 RepID=UPI0018F7707B|nr:hypothetical protein [Actinoplanes sp. ATCC 53533]